MLHAMYVKVMCIFYTLYKCACFAKADITVSTFRLNISLIHANAFQLYHHIHNHHMTLQAKQSNYLCNITSEFPSMF